MSLKQITEKEDGWSEWISPFMDRSYRLGCCDCGLVHNIRFQVIKKTSQKGRRWWGTRMTGMKVMLKAQRNNRSTSLTRKKSNYYCTPHEGR